MSIRIPRVWAVDVGKRPLKLTLALFSRSYANASLDYNSADAATARGRKAVLLAVSDCNALRRYQTVACFT